MCLPNGQKGNLHSYMGLLSVHTFFSEDCAELFPSSVELRGVYPDVVTTRPLYMEIAAHSRWLTCWLDYHTLDKCVITVLFCFPRAVVFALFFLQRNSSLRGEYHVHL